MNETAWPAPLGAVAQAVARAVAVLAAIPEWIPALTARLAVGLVFWNSARLKVDGFSLRDSTWFLFEHEYALPLIPPDWAAVLATLGEHVFSAMLILGLGARFGALGLLAMTAVIQTFVYPEAWQTHLLWAASLLYVVVRGPGAVSIDHLIARRMGAIPAAT